MTASVTEGRGFGLQVVLLAAARLSTVAAFFGVSVVAARLLPPDAVGSAAVGQTIGMIAGLVANGGLNISAIYFLQRAPGERRATVERLTALGIAAAAGAILVALLSAPVAFGLVLAEASWPLLVAAALMGATMIAFELSGAVLLGLGHSGRFTVLELVRGWGSLAAVALLLLGPWRADGGLVLGLALGYAAAAVLGFAWTERAGMSIAPRYDLGFSAAALRFGLRGQVGNVFQFLGVRLDLLVVPALLDLRAAGIYYLAVRVSDVVGQVATAASSLVFPRVAGQEDRHATELTERAVRLTVLAVAVAGLLLGLGGELVLRLAFGPEYAAGAAALAILLVATVPLAVGRVLAADLKGRGRPGVVSLAAGLSVVATVAFDFALVPMLGIEGAALASVLTYLASTTALLLAYRGITRGRLGALVPRPSDVSFLLAAVRRPRQPMDGRA